MVRLRACMLRRVRSEVGAAIVLVSVLACDDAGEGAVDRKAAGPREQVAAMKASNELGGRAPEAASSADEEARVAASALRKFWPIARKVTQSSLALARCQDEARGYSALQQCLQTATTDIAGAARLFDELSLPREGCAKEIASAVAEYAGSSETWIASFKRWFDGNHGLRRAMAGKRLKDVCRGNADCEGQDLSGPSFEKVNSIACTKRLFKCGAADNVCSANEAANRLGMGNVAPVNDLTVRATGTAIH